ncbi:MAG: ABC transporter permease [Solirubrobacterales bacterium]|nr:ABC transporter permease [Solirubrobacterales bacterium]
MADSLTMATRCLRISRRQIDALLTALLLPMLLMVVFVELFGGALHVGTSYVDYVVPGVLVLCAGFSSGLTAVAVCQDMQGGIVDRLRAMDVRGASVLAGHVAASVARNALSGVLVVGLAFALGFAPHADLPHWLAAAGILLAYVTAVSWLSAAIGLLASSPEAANGVTFLVMFLPYASSAFVPVYTMPRWLHGFAGPQPISQVADSLRGLLLGAPVGGHPWLALAWCSSLLVVSVVASGFLFARRAT